MAPKKHGLSLDSNPKAAKVYVNGVEMGETPVKRYLKSDKEYKIEFIKDGYKSVTKTVGTKVGAGWVILDVLSGIIPAIVDGSTKVLELSRPRVA